MILNDNIKLIREKAGVPQSTFAGLFEISVSNLKSYENMNVSPKRPIITRIAKFAGISEEDLLTKKLSLDDIKLYTEEAFADDEKEKDRRNMLKVQKGIGDAFLSKYVELQNEYIGSLKAQEEALTHFRDLISEVNQQRNADMNLLSSMVGELSKRLDRLGEQFDDFKNDAEKRIDDLVKDADKAEGEIYEIRRALDRL